MINGILNTGLLGLQQAQSRVNESADKIAHSVTETAPESTKTSDLATSLVELKIAAYDAKANIKVIETASDLIGTLLETKS